MSNLPGSGPEYPCSWDQNERLNSARRGPRARDRYRIDKVWRIKDRSRRDDVARAWRALVARHPVLRVAYRQYRPGYWVQRVLPPEAVDSWLTMPDDASDKQIAKLRSLVGLRTGQLFSIVLVRRATCLDIHFTIDHVCLDAQSLVLVIDEWSRFIDGEPPACDEIDDKFLRLCLERPPSPEMLDEKMDECKCAPEANFPPYALAPLTTSERSSGYTFVAKKVRLPWDRFPFDAQWCAAGIGPALLVSGLNALHGTDANPAHDFPMIGIVSGKPSREYEGSVGPFSAWIMLSVPAGRDDLGTRARKVNGRLLTALRRPPLPFALETAIRVPDLIAARYWPYDCTPRCLYSNHLGPAAVLTVDGKRAEALPIGGLRGFGLARVMSRSLPDALELEFAVRSDLLSAGVAEYLARHATEQSQIEFAMAVGADG